MVSRRPAPADVLLPTTPEGWRKLLSRPLGVERYFTREAVRDGTTKKFLDAYTAQHRCCHANAVPVEDLLGEVVAALCPDCDQQLPASSAPEPPRDYEAEHRENHHGHPEVFLLACRPCAEECNPQWRVK